VSDSFVTVSSRSLYAAARPSVCRLSVCNARAPYSAGWNFRQYFKAVWSSVDIHGKFYGDHPREPLRREGGWTQEG